MAPVEGGKKRQKAKAKAEAEAKKDGKAEGKAEGKGEGKPAASKAEAEPKVAPAEGSGGGGEKAKRSEDAYSASAVVFFTRDDAGAVSKVLMATEARKVQASHIGLEQKGKVIRRMLLFPMGRREKKDKGDTVETAKREYIEETGDFGGLSQYLDFADFSAEPPPADDPLAELRKSGKFWTGTGNMAVYFAPAGMINLFCEVPAKASESSDRKATGGVSLEAQKAAAEKAAAEAAEAAAAAARGEPPRKKQKGAGPEVGNPSYHVGKTDHLEPRWIDAAVLREAVSASGRSPVVSMEGESEECRLFATAASVLRLPEVREWLGAPKAAAA